MRTALRGAAVCIVGGLWLLPGSLEAQASPSPRPLSLAEARAMAQRSNLELAAARQGVAAAAGRQRQAGSFPNPTLSYSREQTSRDGESNAQDIVSVDQALEVGGTRGARRDAAAAVHAAAEAHLVATAARIDYDVARSYGNAVAAQRRAALAAAAAASFQRARRVSRARLEAGDVSGYQDRRLGLEAGRYAALRLEADVARDSALLLLISLVGLTDSADVAHALSLTDTLTPARLVQPADSFLALALARRPELRAALLEAEAATATARLTRAERIPTPVLSGGYKRERLATGESLAGFVAGVSLPLPLWDRRAGAVDAARAEASQREAQAEEVRRQTIRAVQSAFDAHQSLAQRLELLQEQLGDDARAARRAAEAAYLEGEIGLVEWLDAVRAYHEAEATYAVLWAEYIARRAALERATGASLF